MATVEKGATSSDMAMWKKIALVGGALGVAGILAKAYVTYAARAKESKQGTTLEQASDGVQQQQQEEADNIPAPAATALPPAGVAAQTPAAGTGTTTTTTTASAASTTSDGSGSASQRSMSSEDAMFARMAKGLASPSQETKRKAEAARAGLAAAYGGKRDVRSFMRESMKSRREGGRKALLRKSAEVAPASEVRETQGETVPVTSSTGDKKEEGEVAAAVAPAATVAQSEASAGDSAQHKAATDEAILAEIMTRPSERVTTGATGTYGDDSSSDDSDDVQQPVASAGDGELTPAAARVPARKTTPMATPPPSGLRRGSDDDGIFGGAKNRPGRSLFGS